MSPVLKKEIGTQKNTLACGTGEMGSQLESQLFLEVQALNE